MARFEIWSDIEGNSGVRLAIFRAVTSARHRRSIDGKDEFRLNGALLDPAWAFVQEERVMRVVKTPTNHVEFRLRNIRKIQKDDLLADLQAEGIRFDLAANTPLLERIEANGLAQLHFELYSLPPTTHVDVALGAFAPFTVGAPAWFNKGTIELTKPLDMIYDWDTPLSALQELAALTLGELEVVRNGTQYDIHLRTQIGVGGDKPLFTVKRNILSIEHSSSSKDMGNRVYPKGAEFDGISADISENAFLVTAVSGSDLTLESDVVLEAGQWDSLFLLQQDDTVVAITGSTAPNVITAAGHTTGVDDLVTFVRNSSGAGLTYVDLPSSQTAFGHIKSKVLDRSDIPGINNFAFNGFLQNWTEGGRGTAPCIPDFSAPGGVAVCISRTSVGLKHLAPFDGADGELLSSIGTNAFLYRVESTRAISFPNGLIFLNQTLGTALGSSNFGYYIQEGNRAVNTTLPGPIIDLALYADAMVVEADVDNFGGAGACADASLVAQWQGPLRYLQAQLSFFGGTIKARIFRFSNGAFTQIGSTYDTGLGASECDVSRRLKFVVGPGLQELYVDGTLRVSGTDTVLDGEKGFAGFLTEDPVDTVSNRGPGFDNFSLAAGPNEIVMFGLPTGWTIEACGLSPAVADANGIATLDLGGAALGCTDVVVKDDLGAVQDTFVGTFGLFPGDEFFYECDVRTPGTFASLNRIHNGHLFFDNFSTQPQNTCWRGGLLQLSGKFQQSLIGSSGGVMQTNDPPQDEYHYKQEQCWQRATMLLQATIRSLGGDDSEVGIGKAAIGAAINHVGYVAYVSDAGGGTLHLARLTHTAPAQPVRNSLGTASFSFAADTDYILQAFFGDGVQEARLWSGGSIIASVSATDGNHFSSAHVGELSHVSTVGIDNSQWDDYFSHDGKDIVVQNMPAGHTARLLDVNGTVLGSAVESGGVATIDTLTITVPLSVNVLRAVTVVTSGGVEVVRFQGVVHPGDIYEVR